MKKLSSPNILLIVSASCVTLAISLAGVSLGKSVKWSLYNSGTNYGDPTLPISRIYAYQTLWTSFDVWKGPSDITNAQAYNVLSNDSWRSIVRVLVLAATGPAGLSLAILLKFSFIPCLNSKSIILNIGRGVSSFIAISAGSTLGYALHYYKSNYRSLLCPSFYDALSHYPDEDNLSIGFYMVSTASALLFLAAILNIINIVLLIKTGMINASKATVNPVP